MQLGDDVGEMPVFCNLAYWLSYLLCAMWARALYFSLSPIRFLAHIATRGEFLLTRSGPQARSPVGGLRGCRSQSAKVCAMRGWLLAKARIYVASGISSPVGSAASNKFVLARDEYIALSPIISRLRHT